MKKLMKIIALFISLIMMVQCFSVISFAETMESEVTDSISLSTEEPAEECYLIDEQEVITDEIIGNVAEITSLREENVKHFRLSDGTYEAVVYSQPVHRKDKNGEWQNIDNTIELKTDAKVSKYVTQDSRVSFANKFEVNSDLFTLSENGYSISMSLLNGGTELGKEIETIDFEKLSTPIVNNSSSKRTANVFSSLEEAKSIDNKSAIVYNGIRKNTNLEYVLSGNDVKENIIINAPCESYEYIFQITLDGLYAELDGNVIFIKDIETSQTKYTIPTPYMYDANGTYSYEVSYALEQVKDEIYLLVISADAEWINSAKRAFPVVIDPSVTTDYEGYDSYTNSAYPNNNYGSGSELWVSNTRTTYIKIDIPTLPEGATIKAAYLNIPYYYHITTGSLKTAAYMVTSNWSENTITHNNAPTLGTRLESTTLSASTSITQSTPGNANYYISSAVKDWVNGTSENYGIAIKREESETATNQSVIFKSYEAGYEEPSHISINYSCIIPDGVYAIENVSLSNMWMSVENDSCWAGAKLQYEQSAIDPTDSSVFDRSRLFKITRVGNTDRYTIRSMLNNNLSFGIVGDKIVTKEIPSADTEVMAVDTFEIQWNEEGFIIEPYNSSKLISIIGFSSADLSYDLDSTVTPEARWTLKQYTGANLRGFVFSRPSSWRSTGQIVGTSGTVTLMGWSTNIDANTLSMNISTGYEQLGTGVWNSTENKFTFTASNPGLIKIDMQMKYSDGTLLYNSSIEHRIVPQAGTYYIQNASTEKYVDIEGPSATEGAIIQQWIYIEGNQKKWIIEHVSGSGGYIRLKSVYSGLYIGVDSSNTTSIKQYSTQNDYTLWKIDRSVKGNLIFTCKATESGNLVLSVPLSSNINGTDLTQLTYTDDDNTRDEWYLIKKVVSMVNYYDETFLPNMYRSLIGEAVSFANLVYSRYYNVGIYMDGNETYNSFGIDDCNLGTNNPCTAECGSCVEHHKNFFRIHQRMLSEVGKDNDHIYVLWTNHNSNVYCDNGNPVNHIALTKGVYRDLNNDGETNEYYYYPIIVFLNVSNKRKINMSLNLVHEIAHVLGMMDVYDDDGHDVENATVCVMEQFEENHCSDYYDDLLNNNDGAEPFCQSCKVKMLYYTSNVDIRFR